MTKDCFCCCCSAEGNGIKLTYPYGLNRSQNIKCVCKSVIYIYAPICRVYNPKHNNLTYNLIYKSYCLTKAPLPLDKTFKIILISIWDNLIPSIFNKTKTYTLKHLLGVRYVYVFLLHPKC